MIRFICLVLTLFIYSTFVLGEQENQTNYELIKNEYISLNHQDKLQSIDVSTKDFTLVFNKNNHSNNPVLWYTIYASSSKKFELILASNQTDWSLCPFLIPKNQIIKCLKKGVFIENSRFRLRVNQSSLVERVYITIKSKQTIMKNETLRNYEHEFQEAYSNPQNTNNFIIINDNKTSSEIQLFNKTHRFYWYYIILPENNVNVKIVSDVKNGSNCPYLVLNDFTQSFKCVHNEYFHTVTSFKLRIDTESLEKANQSSIYLQIDQNITKNNTTFNDNSPKTIIEEKIFNEYLIKKIDEKISKIFLSDNKTEQLIFQNNTKSYVIWYAVISLSNFNIEVTIDSPEIDWLKCPFAVLINNHTYCLQNKYFILNQHFLIRVNQSALIETAKIQFRSIIHGCSFETETKPIEFIYNSIPKIVYNSKFPCKYNISIPNNMMLLLKIEKFNSTKSSANCNTYVKLSGQFDSLNQPTDHSIAKFCHGKSNNEYEKIIIRNNYLIIDIGNNNRDTVQIEIDIKGFHSCGETFKLSGETDLLLTSIGFITPKLDEACHWYFYTKNDSYEIGVSLIDYEVSNQANSKLIGYSYKKNENFTKFINFNNLNKNISDEKYIGANSFTLQFFRPNLDDKDNFKIKIYTIPLKKHYFVYTKHSGYIMSVNYPLFFPDYSYVDHEIQVKDGYRIVLLLEYFNVHGCTTEECDTCEYGVLIKIGKNEEFTKLCGKIEEKLQFFSYSNSLIINFRYGKTNSDNMTQEISGYRFRYYSVPVCNNTYYQPRDIINFNSIYSLNSSFKFNQEPCKNLIIACNEQSRILFYFVSWNMKSLNGEKNHDCKHSDHLSVSSSYIKTINPEKRNLYCNELSQSPIVSKMNVLQLQTYSKGNSSVFNYEVGYVSYKYIYNKLADEFTINFNETIDKRAKNGIIDLLEYTIQVPNEYYIIPTIYDCDINLVSGRIQMRTEREIYSFNTTCGKDSSNVLIAMSSVIIIEFSGVSVNDLRNNLKFSVQYKSLPRIFKSKTGLFESFDFSTHLFSSRKQNINYTWLIDLESIYYIKLDIMNLTNCNNILDLNIQDSDRRIIYNKEQLCQNFKNGKNSLDFATNKLILTLNYLKNARSQNNQLPYLKCSYNTSLRIITDQKGEIFLRNSHTHFKRNWIVKAPVDHLVVVDINYSLQNMSLSYSQLKFSYLGSQYSTDGVYHFNIGKPILNNNTGNNTNIVVSKSNIMKIEYISDNNDSLDLSYRLAKNVYNSPCGIIKPFIQTDNHLPKICDQSWILKSDYSKKIKIYVSFIDLPVENPCSSAKVNIIDSNDKYLASLCGNLANISIVSKTSEVTIQFTTQYNKFFFEEEKDEITYNGFKLFYNFIEEIGDCFFQNMDDIMCGYKNIGESQWEINENSSFIKTHDQKFLNLFCESCFLKTTNAFKPAKLISSSLPPSKVSLKFDYKLISGLLSVSIIPNKMVDKIFSLPLNLIETNEWISAQSIIIQPSFYQILFEFIPHNDSKNGFAALDNIQLYESLSACQDRDSIDNFGCLYNGSKTQECAKTTNICFKNLCNNNGTCVNDVLRNSYQCICSKSYTGPNCETLIDSCKGDCKGCSNKTLAQENSNCETFASVDKDYCKIYENPCNQLYGHGDCFNAKNLNNSSKTYSCSCNPLFTGKECEIKVNTFCLNNYCNKFDKKAKCYDLNGKSFCECSLGFSGKFCQNNNDCQNITCSNDGKCLDELNMFKCDCPNDYSGRFCEIAKYCEMCLQNHTIYCDEKSERCICDTGYSGEFCENKNDLCKSNPCFSGKCINKQNNFECLCDKGFKGSRCDIKISVCDTNPCSNGGTCISEIYFKNDNDDKNKFRCDCNPGYTGTYCQDQIDFCKANSCQNGAKCFNELETYSCDCRNDYEGANCDSKSNNCNSANCAYDSTCIDLIEGYRCVCPPNKYGQYCNYTEDLCLNNMCVNGACHNGQHSENQYTCDCYPGYTGDYCEHEINECSSNPCLNDGTCFDLLDQYICSCSSMYTGKKCEIEVNYCSLEKCNYSNTERCVAYSGGFKCICKNGFTGPHCDVKLSQCELLKPCFSGKCIDDFNHGYKCVSCLSGYNGKNCSKFVNFCESNPCKNNGTCFSKLNSYYCECIESFYGKTCELGINNVCASNKCKNNGICKPKNDETKGYTCVCSSSFSGSFCEYSIDLCKDVSCEFSYCVNGSCVCNPNIPYCKKSYQGSSLSCLNGANRVDILQMSERKPKCFCESGLNGEFCETSIYCNSSKSCGSVDFCRTIDSNYECNCKEPLIGHKCNKKLDEYLKTYGMYIKSEKREQIKKECQFGQSRISKILIGLIVVMVFMSSFIGFAIGHCIIKAYKKNSDTQNETEKWQNNNILNDEISPYNIGWFQKSIPRPKLNDY